MPRGGSAKLTDAQRLRRKEKSLGLSVDLAVARDEYLEAAKSIAEKHHRSLPWVSNMLYVGAKKGAKRRSINAWSTFQGRRLRQLNRNLPTGQRYKIGRLPEHEMASLRKEYHALTSVDKEELKEEGMQERAEREAPVKKSNRSIQKDFDATLSAINLQLRALMNRTGCEVVLFGVRGGVENDHAPHVFVSDKAKAWMKYTHNVEPDVMALQLEGFAISGPAKAGAR
ncbi:hypothetical protein BV25DRAFT_1922516 [Artomyces pyxidatus]|uniref:Uncharacterized protein n=1 Tax=Artomyces pyxidatus TaxID=48021 RepID=A0ACB8SEC3_9AGAM|nr:hypothetical protein BV25DRAFT_1922516 [Artomyces pyxidatus]